MPVQFRPQIGPTRRVGGGLGYGLPSLGPTMGSVAGSPGGFLPQPPMMGQVPMYFAPPGGVPAARMLDAPPIARPRPMGGAGVGGAGGVGASSLPSYSPLEAQRDAFFSGQRARLAAGNQFYANQPQPAVRQSAMMGFDQPNPARAAADAFITGQSQNSPVANVAALLNQPVATTSPQQGLQNLVESGRFQTSSVGTGGIQGGVYHSPSGSDLNVSVLPNGIVQVRGTPNGYRPTADQLKRQAAAGERRIDRRAMRIINRARVNKLPPSSTPIVAEAYQRFGIPIPGRPRSAGQIGSGTVGQPSRFFASVGTPEFQRAQEQADYQASVEADRRRRQPPPNYPAGRIQAYQGLGGLLPR